MCSDKKIKEDVIDTLEYANSCKDQNEIYQYMIASENLLDAVNVAEQKYSVFKYAAEKIGNRPIYSESQQAAKLLSSANKYSEQFRGFSRFSDIRKFIEKFGDENPQNVKYLWEKYFLSSINDTEVINELKEIERLYGTKIFVDKVSPWTKNALKFINKEFQMQKEAEQANAKFTPYLHISNYDINFLKRKEMLGYCYRSNCGKPLYIKIRGTFNVPFVLRHESEHFVEFSNLDAQNLKSIFSLIFTITKILIKQINLKDGLQMAKNGINWRRILYALWKIFEKNAVFVEGDMNKYTQEFKQKMIKNGVPEFFTKLPWHDKKYIKEYLNTVYENDKEAYEYIMNQIEIYKTYFPEWF